MDGPEECGWGGDKGGGAVEAENANALHVVLTRLAEAHVIVEWENLPKYTVSQCGCVFTVYDNFIYFTKALASLVSLCFLISYFLTYAMTYIKYPISIRICFMISVRILPPYVQGH